MRGHRRTPEEMDYLRARMIREGFPLLNISDNENLRTWVTITQHRRWEQLRSIVQMTDEQIAQRMDDIRRQVRDRTGRR